MKLGTLSVPDEHWTRIIQHAESEYPAECCGIALAKCDQPDLVVELVPCGNAQDKLHASDPERFPRSSANAYVIDSNDLLQIERRCRESDLVIRVIYHSHPDADAYFSQEDETRALIFGQPAHPDATQLVLSVKSGTFVDHKIFQWHPQSGYIAVDGALG